MSSTLPHSFGLSNGHTKALLLLRHLPRRTRPPHHWKNLLLQPLHQHLRNAHLRFLLQWRLLVPTPIHSMQTFYVIDANVKGSKALGTDARLATITTSAKDVITTEVSDMNIFLNELPLKVRNQKSWTEYELLPNSTLTVVGNVRLRMYIARRLSRKTMMDKNISPSSPRSQSPILLAVAVHLPARGNVAVRVLHLESLQHQPPDPEKMLLHRLFLVNLSVSLDLLHLK